MFRQPCVQFSLQATRPLKHYLRNIGGPSGRGIQLFADYSDQERTVQEKGVYSESKRNCYEEVYRVCLLWTTAVEMEKLLQIGKEFGLVREKLLEFVEKQQKLEEEKEEKRRQLEEEEEDKRRQLEVRGKRRKA